MKNKNLTQHHTIHEELFEPGEDTIRYHQQRIGGFSTAGRINMEPIWEIFNTHEFSIVGLSEINTNTTKSSVCQLLHQMIKIQSDKKIGYSSSAIV